MPASTPAGTAAKEAGAVRASHVFIVEPATSLQDRSAHVISITDMVKRSDLMLAGLNSSRLPAIKESESLYSAFNLLASTGSEILVVTAGGRTVAMVSLRDIARVYHCRVHSKFASVM